MEFMEFIGTPLASINPSANIYIWNKSKMQIFNFYKKKCNWYQHNPCMLQSSYVQRTPPYGWEIIQYTIIVWDVQVFTKHTFNVICVLIQFNAHFVWEREREKQLNIVWTMYEVSFSFWCKWCDFFLSRPLALSVCFNVNNSHSQSQDHMHCFDLLGWWISTLIVRLEIYMWSKYGYVI